MGDKWREERESNAARLRFQLEVVEKGGVLQLSRGVFFFLFFFLSKRIYRENDSDWLQHIQTYPLSSIRVANGLL